MLYLYKSLLDIKASENWNVSNGNNFSYMFSDVNHYQILKQYKIGIFQMEIIFHICSVDVNCYQI